MTLSVLFVALEDGRWGPARLPQEFARLGADVAALCPAGNPILASSHVGRKFVIANPKSARSFAQGLRKAMDEAGPSLIVPGDEQAVVALHYQLRRGRLPARHLEVLGASLGRADRLDTLLMKDQCLALAAAIGIPVPPSITVADQASLAAAGAKLGFPLFVKSSFSWAGLGTIPCKDQGEAAQAFRDLSPRQARSPLKALAKKLLARDWYPKSSAIQLQRPVAGVPAMFCAVAWKGRYLGGFAGLATQTSGATGPSTRVLVGPNAIFERHSAALIEATGASGFLGFDFMWDEETQTATLLECNPRPIQICHLGDRIGADLCALLADALAGKPGQPHAPRQSRDVTLFPQAWFAGQAGGLIKAGKLDAPVGDTGLWQFMLEAGAHRGLPPLKFEVLR